MNLDIILGYNTKSSPHPPRKSLIWFILFVGHWSRTLIHTKWSSDIIKRTTPFLITDLVKLSKYWLRLKVYFCWQIHRFVTDPKVHSISSGPHRESDSSASLVSWWGGCSLPTFHHISSHSTQGHNYGVHGRWWGVTPSSSSLYCCVKIMHRSARPL